MRIRNKERDALTKKRYYEANKEKVKADVARIKAVNKERNRKLIDDYLTEYPCIDCGESDLIVLEFDHVRGIKKDNISNLLANNYPTQAILDEISKCEVRCANCHRRVTYQRRLQAKQEVIKGQY